MTNNAGLKEPSAVMGDLANKMLDSVDDSVVITQATQESGPRVVYVNKAFTSHMGYEASDVLGRSPELWNITLRETDERGRVREALRDGRSITLPVKAIAAGGSVVNFDVTILPVVTDDGRFSIGIARKNHPQIVVICSYCDRIRVDDETWVDLKKFVETNGPLNLSHGICPGCIGRVADSEPVRGA